MRIPKILIPTALALASTIAAAGTVSGGTADCPKYAKCGMAMNHCEPILLAG
jgi:hypothetical protein